MRTRPLTLRLTGPAIELQDFTIDGNKDQQSIDGQRHGIFATNTTGLLLQRITARNFSGDGFYLFNGAVDSFDGKQCFQVLRLADIRDWAKCGKEAAENLLKQEGAVELMEFIRNKKWGNEDTVN